MSERPSKSAAVELGAPRPVCVAVAVALGALLALAPGASSATPARTPALHQEPRGIGQLVAPRDRVEIAYTVDSPRIAAPTGWLLVRSDRGARFARLPFRRKGRTLSAVVPTRLVRGGRLVYRAVVRDRRSGRSITSATSSAWILRDPVDVRLDVHRFGHPRKPDAVVARARAAGVGWQLPEPGQGPSFGPQTFVVARDRTVWLDDGLNNRLLAWRPSRPNAVTRTVPLPERSADHDVAIGRTGAIYVTGTVGRGLDAHHVLYRIDPNGRVRWQTRLAEERESQTSFLLGANSPLRLGPDGTLYCLAGMPGLPGGEPAWMPVATPSGRPLTVAAQRQRTRWPYQPVAGGLRLVSEVYTAKPDTAPHEARYALIDRGGRLVRSWRVRSRTAINFNYATPELVGGDPVVVLDVTAGTNRTRKWEYLVLRLGAHGVRTRFSLSRAVFGDNLLADVRIGPDGNLYQLASSPTAGVTIGRFSLGR